MQTQVSSAFAEIATGPGIWTCRNATGTADIWLDTGPTAGIEQGSVSSSTGFRWHKDDPLIVVELAADTALYAVSDGVQQTIQSIKGVKFASASTFITGSTTQ